MPKDHKKINITEIAEFDPERVDGVGKGANGFPILMLKSIATEDGNVDDVTTAKADAEHDACDTCDGEGTILEGNRKCPKCLGTGKAPKVGESAKAFIESVIKESEGVALSGAPVPPAADCPTCNASGLIDGASVHGKVCVDCGGTGKDQSMTNPVELNAVAADAGRVSVGDPEGRETMDKAASDNQCVGCQAMNKAVAKFCAGCGDDMAKAAAQMCSCGHSIAAGEKTCSGCGLAVDMTKGHDFDPDGFRPAQYSADADETVGCPECESMNDLDAAYCDQCGHMLAGDPDVTVDGVPVGGDDDDSADDDSMDDDSTDDDSMKSLTKTDAWKRLLEATGNTVAKDVVTVADGATFTAPNPVEMVPADSDDIDASGMPGSPSWEATDAQTATNAAQTLMQAAELIRTFASRENIEVAAGEGNDIFDAKAAEMALVGVTGALGIMAQLAFHENLEAQKSLEEEGGAAKAGKRLSNKSVAVLMAARDHLDALLGDNNQTGQSDDDNTNSGEAANKYIQSANKALLAKEIKDMTTEELTKVLDQRDERLVGLLADTFKGLPADNNVASIASAKDANKKSKNKNPKAEMTDLEDEATQGDDESANTSPTGAAKADGQECSGCGAMCKAGDSECAKCGMAMKSEAELTPEEIEARVAAKEAKKALKAARRAEKEAAENAAVAKAIAEGVAEATEAVRTLQDRLATVEKMAAPSTIVRTRPSDAIAKSVERDDLEMRLAQLERVTRETADNDIRKASREEAKEVRDRIAGLSA